MRVRVVRRAGSALTAIQGLPIRQGPGTSQALQARSPPTELQSRRRCGLRGGGLRAVPFEPFCLKTSRGLRPFARIQAPNQDAASKGEGGSQPQAQTFGLWHFHKGELETVVRCLGGLLPCLKSRPWVEAPCWVPRLPASVRSPCSTAPGSLSLGFRVEGRG